MKRDTHVSTAFTLEIFTAECCEAFIAKVNNIMYSIINTQDTVDSTNFGDTYFCYLRKKF